MSPPTTAWFLPPLLVTYVPPNHCLVPSSLLYLLTALRFFAVARHVYGYKKVLDGDGDPSRPDGYGGMAGNGTILVGVQNV